MAPDDIENVVEEEEEQEEEQELNIIDLNNYGMKPYSYRAAGGGSGSTGYSWNGTDITETPGAITVMISDETELTDLAAKVGAGTIAYTAGWQNAWQLDLDGETWVQFIGGDE